MSLQHFQFELSDLTFDSGDIERIMGYEPGESPEPFPTLIAEVFEHLDDHCKPEGGFVVLDNPGFDFDNNTTEVGGKSFLTEKTVTKVLRHSEKLALFICTAGEGIELWAREANESGDPVKGFIIDAFGSAIADASAAKLQEILNVQVTEIQKKITNRYSPGYCDWPVKDQQKLFSFFPEKFCGITLSESSLMHPIKSVSGFIGIGENVRFQQYPCDSCKDVNCIYGRLNRSA
jgi:hypothetical protein